MLDVRTKIGAGGRVIIPSIIREKLHLSVGDDIIIYVKEDEVCITTAEQALHKIREKVKHSKNKESLVDDLFSMRRKEAAHE